MKKRSPRLSLIVAMDEGDLIGQDNGLPWHLPDDLRLFRRHTLGKPIIMGRRTWESLPRRPLPARPNIVVTRNEHYVAPCARVRSSVEGALEAAGDVRETLCIGGASLYAACLPLAERIYLTRVHARLDGDTRFEGLNPEEWRLRWSCEHPADEKHQFGFTWQILVRATR
ncbi:MAG: dihydrofolate reductase [Gammaproteobacteria bacterium]|jgi:dihydrofolate reductase|nr:dihydrofolate reductase [Gammaproteobacteria bacterium]